MNESAVISSAFKNRQRAGLVEHTMQTNPAGGVKHKRGSRI